jgi:hypothetical protein
MINWANRILTNVKFELGDSCSNVISTASNMKAVFPACAVSVISNPAIEDDLDADRDGENAVQCGVQIEIYSKKSLSDAFILMGVANSAMYKMGFVRREGAREISHSDPSIFRVIARYTRVIGANDVINKFTAVQPSGVTGSTQGEG